MLWLTGERCLALFPGGTIAKNPHHCEYPTHREQDLNLAETEFILFWLKVCSSDNHYAMAPQRSVLLEEMLYNAFIFALQVMNYTSEKCNT